MAADKDIIRRVKREIIRRQSIDSTRINISCTMGHVDLGGYVRPVKGAVDIDLEEELNRIIDVIMRIPGVKSVNTRYLRRLA